MDIGYKIGYLLFKTHGELDKRTWWIAQIFIWSFSLLTFYIYRKFGFHDALFASVLWLVFFWWKTNVNIKRLHARGSHGWGMFLFLVWCEVPLFGWITGFIRMGILGKKNYEQETPLS